MIWIFSQKVLNFFNLNLDQFFWEKLNNYFETNLALTTVVWRFVLRSSMELHVDSFWFHKLQNLHWMLERLEHAVSEERKRSLESKFCLFSSMLISLDLIEQFWIGDFDIPRQIPGQMHHRHDRLVAFKFVPFVANSGEIVLTRGEWTDVPCDVVAPSNRLHPMNAAVDE